MSCKSKKTLAIHADSLGRLIGHLPRFLWPFSIIDLAKNFHVSHMFFKCSAAGPTNPHTRFVSGGSVFRSPDSIH